MWAGDRCCGPLPCGWWHVVLHPVGGGMWSSTLWVVSCGPLPCGWWHVVLYPGGWCQVSGVAPWGGVICWVDHPGNACGPPWGGVMCHDHPGGGHVAPPWGAVSGVRCRTLGWCHVSDGHMWFIPGAVSCVICWVASEDDHPGNAWTPGGGVIWWSILGMHGPLGAVSAGRCQLGGVIWWEVVV